MCIYKTTRNVRFQDVDGAGIVFFCKLLEYCHDAYFEKLTIEGIQLNRAVQQGPYLLPLVHTEADFKRPLSFGDEFEVRIESVDSNASSFKVNYRICSPRNPDHTHCFAQTVHVAVSKETFKPLKSIPEEIQKALHISQSR